MVIYFDALYHGMENVNAEALGENLFCKHIYIYKYAITGCFDKGIFDMR